MGPLAWAVRLVGFFLFALIRGCFVCVIMDYSARTDIAAFESLGALILF